MTQHSTDIVVIGAGPVGLFAVFEAGMLKMRCHVIDALDMAGGQCAALYPEKPIYDIPGHPSIMGQELVDKLKEQAAPFNPTYHFGQRVEKLDGTSGNFTVTTSTGTQIRCKAIIIAAGCGAFGPNRPPMEGLEAYEGKSVFYMVAKREDYRGKKVAIAGGGDSAVDWALKTGNTDIADKVMKAQAQIGFGRSEVLAEPYEDPPEDELVTDAEKAMMPLSATPQPTQQR